MTFVTLGTCFIVLGLIGILIERRSFYAGLTFSFGILLTILAAILQVSGFLITKFPKVGQLFDLLIVLIVLSLFFFTVIYLIINTFVVQRKEGRSPTALLSLFLGINIFVIIPLPFYLDFIFNEHIPKIVSFVILVLCILNFTLTGCFVFYLIYSVFYQFIPFKGKVDYIIVLGSGIRSEEVPPLLKSRLDKAIEYFNNNKDTKLIVSGGQGHDEPVSEAYAMRKYLLAQNIPKNQIIMEDQSTTTFENMQFSKAKITKDQGTNDITNLNILFSTNNYHVLRAAIYTRKAKLKAQGVGAPTAHYFLPTALIREFIALLVMNKISISILSLLLTILLGILVFS
ncbi:YdcF family protein [Staphylococcus chromogenes]|uniref:YdcF family protein n=2 Tax=Staphylococcus chromogenes TaxID=46126 RepID=UPI001E5C4469|nr:YdcF family protein [Staphylococcus chromogenes]MCD8904340.1 YdcF family protein [Staphylococcus chromogenes]